MGAVEKCLICTTDFKDGIEKNSVQWLQLYQTLSSADNDKNKTDDIKDDCQLCPQCFGIIEETKQLRCRLEEIRQEVKAKIMIVKARISDSDGNLQSHLKIQNSRLNSLRKSLLELLNDDEAFPGVEVKLELEEQEYPNLDSLLNFEDGEDVEETLKEEIDDLNLSNVDHLHPDSSQTGSGSSEDDYELEDQYSTKDSTSETESEYDEYPNSKSTKKGKASLKRKAKTTTTTVATQRKLRKKNVPKTRSASKIKKAKKSAEDEDIDSDSDDSLAFKCDICETFFKCKSSLKAHRINIHLKSPGKYSCTLCDKKFNLRTERRTHEKTDHQGSFPCSFCKRKFMGQGRLEVHIVTAHETAEKNHTCHLCNKQFTLEISFNRHIRLHKREKEKPFVCDVCDCRWTSEEELTKHRENVHTKKRFECEICGHGLSSKSGLARHNRIHTGEKPYKCDLCDETFIDGVAKIYHKQKVHSSVDDHQLCTVCGQRFISKYILKQHMERHEGKVYPCDQCGETTFKDRYALKTHKIKVHGEPGFVCDECGAKFTTSKGLKTHKMGHAGEKPHACDLCGAAFLSKWVLANHRRSHTGERPFVCTECNKGFKARKHLVTHMRGVHSDSYTPSNKYKCSHCGKCYPRNDTLEGHIRQIHTGERPFSCQFCAKTFAIKTNLRLHLKSHGVLPRQSTPRLPRSTRARPATESTPVSVPESEPILHPPVVFNSPQSNPIQPFQHNFDPRIYHANNPVNPGEPIRRFL